MIEKFMMELKKQGYTQDAIAARTGLSQAVISKLFRGGSFNVQTLIILADTFKVSTDHILARNQKQQKSLEILNNMQKNL